MMQYYRHVFHNGEKKIKIQGKNERKKRAVGLVLADYAALL